MKTNKKTLILITAILLIIVGTFGYFYLNTKNIESTLNLGEKTWIENNKNKVIDLGIVNEVALLNHSGDGLFFSFLQSLEEETGLEFNRVSYSAYENINEKYSFKRVEEIKKNDIAVYTDNYVLIGKKNIKYNNLKSIDKSTIGVLENDLSKVNKYLNNESLLYKSSASLERLLHEFMSEENDMDYIVLHKLILFSVLEKEDGLCIN